MTENYRTAFQNRQDEEKTLTAPAGLLILLLNIILMLAAVFALGRGFRIISTGDARTLGTLLVAAGFLYLLLIGPVIFAGLKVLGPNEALVFTLFGKYYGTLKKEGLRGSSQEIAEKLRKEIQAKVDIAGLGILEARITHLAYAPEIAAAMLQRQQAAAIIDARQMIVEGAVGMVETALAKLNEHEIVELDEERKAAMVSNLLVVLCGSRDPQPVINSGSLY
jgi:regulator of protease activity HflC (stomatin/prohibitin superfamily)